MAKLIVIEGSDSSGKETQSRMLVEKLNNEGIRAIRLSNPFYDSPTGKIIASCYLGKEEYCRELFKDDSSYGWFNEGAVSVDPLVASVYYAADRRYNLEVLREAMRENEVVILDRYIYSNMAYQGAKFETKEERDWYLKKCELLEFEYFELPRPDYVYFLYVPHEVVFELLKKREEASDQHEANHDYLIRSEEVYFELASRYGFEIIDCISNGCFKSREEIQNDVYKRVRKIVK